MTRFFICAGFASLLLLGASAVYAADTKAPAAAAETGAADNKDATADSAAPAPGEGEVRFKMDEQMQRGKADYDAALKTLTPEQLAELNAFEKEFASTMEIDMQIYHRAGEMEHCLSSDAFFKADRANVKSFVTWRQEMLAIQEKRQNEHKVKRQKIKYMKPYVLHRYYAYQAKMLKMLGAAVAKGAYDSGAFKNTNCDDLSKRLKQGL